MKTSLDDFKRLLVEYRGLATWAIGGALVAPFAASLLEVSPPWPRGIVAITAIVELAVLIGVFHSLGRSSKRNVSRAMAASAVLFCAAGVVYLYDVSQLTYQVPTTDERFVKGTVCSADALLVYRERCPKLGFNELRQAEFSAETLWTMESISKARLRLVLGWLISFSSLAAGIGSFLCFHVRAKGRKA